MESLNLFITKGKVVSGAFPRQSGGLGDKVIVVLMGVGRIDRVPASRPPSG